MRAMLAWSVLTATLTAFQANCRTQNERDADASTQRASQQSASALPDLSARLAAGEQTDSGSDAIDDSVDPLTRYFRQPQRYAAEMEQFAKEVRADEAPEYVHRMVAHLKRLVELMQAHQNDCEKTVEELTKYLQVNRDELHKLREQGDADEAAMTEQEQTDRSLQTMILMGPFVKEMVVSQVRFAERCPEHARKAAELLAGISPE